MSEQPHDGSFAESTRPERAGRVSEKRVDVLLIALLVAIATVLFADVLFTGANFYFRDLPAYHFPMKKVVRDAIESGEFPFWNRYASGGQPLAANPAYELFYPPQLLILVGSYPFGFSLHILVHVYAALVGMYLLLRQIRLGPPASFFGAISFGLGGPLIGSMWILPTFFIWALMPLVAWSVIRFLQSRTIRRFSIAAILSGVQMLVGEPMALAQVWLLIVFSVLLAGAKVPRWRAAVLSGLIAIAGVVVASAQLFPAADHFRDSVRSRGFPYTTVKEYSMPPSRPIELVIPHAFGVAKPVASTWWGKNLFDRKEPYVASLHLGILVPMLVIAGFLLRLPGARTAAALALLSYLLAIGDKTPVLQWLYAAGVLKSFRYPEKFSLLGLVALLIFASLVADRFLSGDSRTRRAVTIGAAIVATMSLGTMLWTWMPRFSASFASVFAIEETFAAAAASSWRIGAAVALAALALVVLHRFHPRGAIAGGAFLLVAQLFVLANQLAPRVPAEVVSAPAVAKDLRGDSRTFAVFHRGDWLPDDENFVRHSTDSLFWTYRNGMRPYVPWAWGFRTALELDFDETALVPTHALLGTMRSLGNSGHAQWAEPFMTISNVEYVLDYRDYDLDRREAGGDRLRSKPVEAKRVPHQPRYFFATRLQQARSSREANRFFVKNPRPFGIALVPFPPIALSSARVIAMRESANAATIDVAADGPSFLVATVTRHKYWQATIDGKPAQLVPANIAYQGLFVPKGTHRIEMRYHNPVVVRSLWTSSIVGFVLLIGTLFGKRELRKRERHAAIGQTV